MIREITNRTWFADLLDRNWRDPGYAEQMTMPRKCQSCVPGLDCEFYGTDDLVVETFFLDCTPAARTSAIDVTDAADVLLRDVDLDDRAAVRAGLLANPTLDIVARAIESGRFDDFVERAIKCARARPPGTG